ncbi:BRD4-interacting chromatin-remodeling complex-associated protein-like [Spea bombifrons]|uniref:BRD4-interacting chromatin-remodeling complex-associated protein-like n=1 Tax=Spea bombifrons TaxID=233779 RepID=UPI00234AC5BF|nr:BRD4-interacting chromatin-remodeling complex-associated protein-like [Spea bombifrons]XP_053315243.1 BRD4-interacting chromatin-remodeling complex-associated protein-like [Spea bombifrons]XP_053315244.1 BRD4-interacting chromatin-remodeling complex-associated protein-like [Spea bombifrons]
MDDDDDSGLFDFIGSDPQALNFYLHGPGSKSANNELTSPSFPSSNSNSIFANASHADPKSSIKIVHNQMGETSTDGLQMSDSLQFLQEELESSSMPDLNEDILQKSLDEANITEQILAEEAYLDASIGSGQQFSNVPLHPLSSASFTQTTNVQNYSGQSLHSVGVTHVPVVQQQVGTSFQSNTVGVPHGFMQHGIVPNQHVSNSNHSSSGHIRLISSINNQAPVMTINNLDGSQIILKGGQQASSNASGGLMGHRQTLNGNTVFGRPNQSPGGQQVTVPFNSGSFQTSLPVHNIIIHRGSAPNANKSQVNIQPKPIQVGQQAAYNVNNYGIQQHHVHQGVSFTHGNPPQSSVCQPVDSHQPDSRKSGGQQLGGSIVIQSAIEQSHGHSNQFLIPAGLSVSPGSVQHIQNMNNPLIQTQLSHLSGHQLAADHLMQKRNAAAMVKHCQTYSGQMLNCQGTSVQLIPGQTFTGPGGQVILNHGQMSPTVLQLSPGQVNNAQGRSAYQTGSSMPAPNRFTVVGSGTVLHNVGSSFQTSPGGEPCIGDQQQRRIHTAMSQSHVSSAKSTSIFSNAAGTEKTHLCSQKKVMNLSPVSTMKTQDSLRQPHMPSMMNNASGPNSGNKTPLASAQQECLIGSSLQNMEADGIAAGLRRPAVRQLSKETLTLQHLQKDQEACVMPDKSTFKSLDDAVKRLIPYHLFKGSLPTDDDLQKVDNEFEAMATHLLKKTQAMFNKYRLLLLDDAMRLDPSAEMVMLDRMFNQDERAALTREKRMSLVDPDGFLTEFCCTSKFQEEFSNANLSRNDDMADASETVDIPKDQTDLTVSRNSDTSRVVPDKCAASQKFSVHREGLNKDDQKKTGCFPRKQQSSLDTQKSESHAKSSECPSELDMNCKSSKDTQHIAKPQIPTATLRSKQETADVKHHQEMSPGPSRKRQVELMNIPGSPCKRFKGQNESLKATVKDSLELKLGEKHLRKENTGSSSEKYSPAESEEHCADKAVSDARGGPMETDSVLEAAVNSILEC